MNSNSLSNVSPSILNLEKFLSKIRIFAQKFYDPTDDLHGLSHIQRVVTHAKILWNKEGGNWDLIESIIWLHDIGRKNELAKKKNHAVLSKEYAEQYLLKLKCPPEISAHILHGILAHSFSLGELARTTEAKIVSDADKIDALGAIGIYRVCAYQAKHGHGIKEAIQHFHDKILQLKNQMYLETSKQIAQIRTGRVIQFIDDLTDELKLV